MSLNYLAYRLKRRFGCQHDPSQVTADILDGDLHGGPGGEQAAQWCRTCGAYRRVLDTYGSQPHYGEWTVPGRWLAR